MRINEVVIKEATLRRGSRGPEVRKLQLDLGVQPADGIFGPATERAVRDFQDRFDLTVDGIVGPATQRSIEQHQSIDTDDTAPVEPGVENSRWTALSAFGVSRQGGLANNPRQQEAIRELQALLGIEVTGRYDNNTANAVRRYQEENDLYPDGDAGPRTINHMINAVRNQPITSTPLDGNDGSDTSSTPMMDPNAPAGRLQGPVPPEIVDQVRTAAEQNDAVTVITLVNRYERLYNAFNNRPSSNPDVSLYDYFQDLADRQQQQ